MLCRRIIPCLDVADGRTVKGIKFQNLRDIGDPVELGRVYQEQGADELMFLDISATNEGRTTMLEVVEKVAHELMIPFSVGGGVSSLEQVKRLLRRGADKVTVNTAAVERPELVAEIAQECGSQCCVVAIDARRQGESWRVVTHGGRKTTEIDALEWGARAAALGAGEVLLTSWDQDGTRSGFDLALTRAFSELSVPVIASGGAGGVECFVEAFGQGRADAALAASIFHDGEWTVAALKAAILEQDPQIALRYPC
ncbi:MAG: imidazole glycerol phosphate synthase subunit HisF [Candidatus Eremiobacteraeota bacterium]|nr:imidazole glycerol phosphate synthase subunit HisF [Candidatus Eremiobacteraeota bacterium]